MNAYRFAKFSSAETSTTKYNQLLQVIQEKQVPEIGQKELIYTIYTIIETESENVQKQILSFQETSEEENKNHVEQPILANDINFDSI